MPEHEVMNDDSWFLPSRNTVAGFLRVETIIMQCYENGFFFQTDWATMAFSGTQRSEKHPQRICSSFLVDDELLWHHKRHHN